MLEAELCCDRNGSSSESALAGSVAMPTPMRLCRSSTMWVFAVEALAAVATSSPTARTCAIGLLAETLSTTATGFSGLLSRLFLSLQQSFVDRFLHLSLSAESFLVGDCVVAAFAPTPSRTRCSLPIAGAVEFETAGLFAVAKVLVVAGASVSVLLLLVVLCPKPLLFVVILILRRFVCVAVGVPRHFDRPVVERHCRL